MRVRCVVLGTLLALTIFATLGLATTAMADKVGVAAAVNPDAFSSLAGSPKTQLNISIQWRSNLSPAGEAKSQLVSQDAESPLHWQA